MKKFMIFSLLSALQFTNLHSQMSDDSFDQNNVPSSQSSEPSFQFLQQEAVPPRIFPVDRGSTTRISPPANPYYQSNGYPPNWVPPNPDDYQQNRYNEDGSLR